MSDKNLARDNTNKCNMLASLNSQHMGLNIQKLF